MDVPLLRLDYSESDIEYIKTEIEKVLRSGYLTMASKVEEFEKALSDLVGVRETVVVNSGTAALHASMHALGIGPGDEVIVPTITFAASANCVVYQGAIPIFVDVDERTLLVDPLKVEEAITPRTKAIISVDYAGQPCEYDELEILAKRYDLHLVADACHAIGGEYKRRPVGSLADLNVFSFHPVKHVTSGEGGAIATDNQGFASRMRRFRNHGIDTDHHVRAQQNSWAYEMVDLGFNYRLSDIQCALGISQLRKLQQWIRRRREIAQRYDETFKDLAGVQPLDVRGDVNHAYHLYVIRIDPDYSRLKQDWLFKSLRSEGINVNVHYIPVHLHPFYQRNFGTSVGDCPIAETAYQHILSLPIFPKMCEEDVQDVIDAVTKVLATQ